jgi:hypothetical protein
MGPEKAHCTPAEAHKQEMEDKGWGYLGESFSFYLVCLAHCSSSLTAYVQGKCEPGQSQMKAVDVILDSKVVKKSVSSWLSQLSTCSWRTGRTGGVALAW